MSDVEEGPRLKRTKPDDARDREEGRASARARRNDRGVTLTMCRTTP